MKRPIADVRREIRELDSQLTHLIITKMTRGGDDVFSDPKNKAEYNELWRKIGALMDEYPNWCVSPGSKV